MGWYRNLKIAAKLILGFVLVAALAGAVGWIGYTQIHKLKDADTALYQHDTLALRHIGELHGLLRGEKPHLYDAILARTEAERRDALGELPKREAEMLAVMDKYASTLSGDANRQAFVQLQSLNQSRSGLMSRLVEL